MDTIKILLGVTVALLLGALTMSWKNFQHDQRDAPKDELAEVRRQIDEIRKDQERLRLERERIVLGSPALPATPAPGPAPVVPEASTYAGEPVPPAIEESPAPAIPAVPPAVPAAPVVDGAARAKAIQQAPVVAKISEWVEDPQIGTFATAQIIVPASVTSGTILCVRRNSGILGRLKVSEITPEGAIVNPQALIGDAKPKVGDELILEPK